MKKSNNVTSSDFHDDTLCEHLSEVKGMITFMSERLDKQIDLLKEGKSNTYFSNKQTILSLFRATSGNNYSLQNIVLRLTVIDSMYSTNMGRRYFGIDDLAYGIYALGTDEKVVAQMFSGYLSNTNDEKENSVGKLFSRSTSFGIHKNLKDAGNAISLLSKYAYYQLMVFEDEYKDGFPIYDSLAIEVLPLAYKYIKGKRLRYTREESSIQMSTFVERIKMLKDALGDLHTSRQIYDSIDIYLWTLGKVLNGNLSLIMGKEDYIKVITNMGLKVTSPESENPPKINFEDKVKELILVEDRDVFEGCAEKSFFDKIRAHAKVLNAMK